MNRLIFLVAGNPRLRGEIQEFLQLYNYDVTVFSTASGVISEAEKAQPALFLIDRVLAGEGGLNLCWRIRHHPSFDDTPVVLLSPTANEDDLVHALSIGADDYIRIPKGLPELICRIRIVIRRFERTPSPALIQAGPLELNRRSMTLAVEGRDVPVNLAEFRLLDFLIRNPCRVFTRDQILDAVWGAMKFVTPSCVNVQVRRLRVKIEPDPAQPQYLQTVRGSGYRFKPDGNKEVPVPKPKWPIIVPSRLPHPSLDDRPSLLQLKRGAA
jgi:DNA-binding response OmpR family regulator